MKNNERISTSTMQGCLVYLEKIVWAYCVIGAWE